MKSRLGHRHALQIHLKGILHEHHRYHWLGCYRHRIRNDACPCGHRGNHLRAEILASDPQEKGGRRVLFYSGDDNTAKAEVAALIDRIGFAGIDLGSLAVGGKLAQFPGGPLPNQNLVKIG